MPRHLFYFICFLLVTKESPGTPVSFVKDLVPILSDQCLTCHEEKKAKGDYRVDSYERVLKAGDSGEPPIVTGKPDASILYQLLVTHEEDDRMPQKGDALPSAQTDLFKRWIAEGAKFDGPNPKASLADLAERKEAPASPEKYPRPIPITALEWLKEGKILAASGYGEVILWEVDTRKVLRRLPGMPERVLALSLHPDGKTLAVAGGVPGRSGELLLVNLDNGKVLRRLPGAKDTLLTAAFSPDGRFLAAGGAENIIKVYQTENGKELWKAEAHADWVTSLVFSHDSKHLASASRDRTSRVFNAETGVLEAAQTSHTSSVVSAVFDKEGKTVISASSGEVRRWPFGGETDGGGSPPSKLLKSPRQEVTRLGIAATTLIAANTEGKSYAYDLAKPGSPQELLSKGIRLNALSVSPDGLRVAVGSTGGEITVFDLTQPKSSLTWVAAPGLQASPVPK